MTGDATPTREENGLELDESESQQLREVFSTIFPQYLEPLEELLTDLFEGQASSDLLEGIRAAVSPLLGAAESIGVATLTTRLQEFRAVVDSIPADAPLSEAHRGHIEDAFANLKAAVQSLGSQDTPPKPEAPATEAKSGFVARLSAVDGVSGAEVQRMLAAGISSAEHVKGATVDEIAAVTGLSADLAARIHQAFGGKQRASGSSTSTQDPKKVAATESLDERFELVALVRERILLLENLRNERRRLVQAVKALDDLNRTVALVSSRLTQSRAQLAHEKDLAQNTEEDLSRLRDDVARTRKATLSAAGDESDAWLDNLEERLRKLKERLAHHLRG